MASNTEYEIFKPLNQEFTFDVDVSNLPCGLNGALYFSEMSADGGLAAYSGNKAGAQYGTGYCDSQCPRDLKFINGVVRISLVQPFILYLIFSDRQILWTGMPLLPTLALEAWVPAAARWIYGRPTLSQRHTPLTLAPLPVKPSALVLHVAPPADTAVFATPTVVISTPTAWATLVSTGPA